MDVTDLTQDHPAIYVADAGDGHNDRITRFHDVSHFRLNVSDLPIQKFDLLYSMNDLNRDSAVRVTDRVPCENP